MSTTGVLRVLLGTAGCALIAVGGLNLLFETRSGTPAQVAVWLAGSVALHDFVAVPLVLLAGLGLRRLPERRLWRGALLVAGVLTLTALPVLLRPEPANPSLLPLDYPRNWALLLAAVACAAAGWALARRLRNRRS